MAAAAAPPPTNPAAAFPAGDPRNAEYGETIAALEHAYTTTLAGDAETLSDATSNAQYQRSLIGQAEPGGYRSEANKANAGGILESGINAQDRGTLASKYADQRFKVTKGLQETTNRVHRANENAEYTRKTGEAKAATRALGEGYKDLLATSPNEQAPAAPTNANPVPQTPGNPLATEAVNKAFPGGIAEQRKWIKEQAAKKAVG